MKKFIFDLKGISTALLLFAGFNAQSQTDVIIGAGSNTSTTSNGAAADAGPMYCTGGSSSFVFSKHHMVYTAAELATAGLPNNVIITQISWYKANNASYSSSSAAIFDIYLKNSAATGVPTPVPQGFSGITAGATPVYASTSQSFSSNIGWVEFNLSTPFTYTGGALEVTTNWDVSAGGSTSSGASANFAWAKDPGTNILAHSAASQSSDFTMLRTSRAQIRITYVPGGPCTDPPTAGTATVSNNTVCATQNITLGLSGNSMGTGQTYQWQSGPSTTGPWTNFGTSQTSPSLTAPALSGNNFYQCLVTCGASTVASSSVAVNATAGFPGGTYTINAGSPTAGTNFNSFADAIAALDCGITGPVVFNVTPGSGPYTELVSIGNILGASAANPIRINGNGNTVQFATNTTAGQRHLLLLDGAKHIRIDSLNFVSTSTTNVAWGALITGGAEYDSLTNCVFDLSTITNTASASNSGILFSGSNSTATTAGTNGSNCYIAGNHVKGSDAAGGVYYGISISSGTNDNNIIIDNIVESYYYYAIYLGTNNNNQIRNNIITRQNKTTGFTTNYGIYLASGASEGHIIDGNIIHTNAAPSASMTSTSYAIGTLADPSVANPIIISNNLIYNFRGSAVYGLYASTVSNTKFLHNTVDISNTWTSTSANYGIYATGTNDGTDFINNNVSITGGGTGTKYGFYYNAAASVSDAQKNNIYVNSTQTGTQNYGYYTTDYASQATFQTAYPALEIGSPAIDPQYVAPLAGNYTPGNSLLLGTGANVLASVPEDINGAARSPMPTPGAFEMPVVAGANAGVVALITPTGSFCPGSQNVQVSIANFGTSALSNFQVHWQLNGVTQSPVTYSGTLAPLTSPAQSIDTISLGNVTISTTSAIKAWTVVTNDIDNSNDSIDVSVSPTNFTISTFNDTVCTGRDLTLNLDPATGYNTGMIAWQSSTNGTTFNTIPNSDQATWTASALTGNTWFRAQINDGSITCNTNTKAIVVVTPTLTGTIPGSRCDGGVVQLSATANTGSTIQWYDAATGGNNLGTGPTFTTPWIGSTTTFYAAAEVGSTEKVGKVAPTNALNLTASPRGLYFNAYQEFEIVDVTVYSTNATAGTGVVTLFDNNHVAITTANVTWPGGGTASAPLAQVIPIGITVPPGTNYSLMMTSITGGIAYETGQTQAMFNTYVSPNGACEILGSKTSATGSVSYTTYYYFYDWTISSACASTRTPVIAAVDPAPIVDLGNDTLVCSSGTLLLDAGNAGATYQWSDNSTGQTKSVTSSGQYYVTVTGANNCAASDTIEVTVTPPPPVSLGNDTAICMGASITLSGGNIPGTTVLWDNNTTTQNRIVSTSGQYTVEVAYTPSCKTVDTINIVVNPLPTVDLGNDTAICGSGTVVLDAENAGASYLWDDGSTMQTRTVGTVGQYHVSVIDVNGCSASDTIEVGYIPSPVGSFTVVEGPNGEMTFNAVATNTTTFSWDFGDGNTATGNPVTNTYLVNGNYNVTLTVVNDCGEEVEIPRQVSVRNKELSINDIETARLIKMYPNPNHSGSVTIELSEGLRVEDVIMYNVLGQRMDLNLPALSGSMLSITLPGYLTNGIYQLIIQTDKGTAVKKLEILR